MGEFDLSLIREFRIRPAFYDRSSPRFKDKIYTAREWQEISNKLGYDVSLLKDRMLQLRNRYNLEKRRLEQLREENPGKMMDSPWPLYTHLHFLSDHIRARRSYKRMVPMQHANRSGEGTAALAELSNSGSNPSSNATPCHAAAPFANGLLTVKMEQNDTESESESQSGGSDDPAEQNTLNNAQENPNLENSNNNYTHEIVPPMRPSTHPSITIRRLDTLQQKQRSTANTMQSPFVHPRQRAIRTSGVVDDTTDERPLKMLCTSIESAGSGGGREQKYTAFGDFMSSSLLELPSKKALLLVEKFTSDLVKVLIQKSEIAGANGGGGGINSSGGGNTADGLVPNGNILNGGQ